MKHFRPLGAFLRRTPFWRPKVGRQNKVEGRQAPTQPERGRYSQRRPRK